jgi:glycosyl transferase family 25
MQLYLINLERSPDRLEWILGRLEQLAICPIRVPAVDGKQLSKEELAKWECFRHPMFGMGPGEFACFLSHRKVWELIARGSDAWGFVAEDDIHISENLPKFLHGETWLPTDAEIVKAETVNQRVWLAHARTAEVFSHRLSVLKSYHGGSAAYFISRDKAKWLLQETESFCSIPDQVLFNFAMKTASVSKIYQIDPALAVQDWAHQSPPGSQEIPSLLLAERAQFHGQKQPKNQSLVSFICYKIFNPLKKLTRYSIETAANLIGKNVVKKIPFESG